jgi:hypothetical protein
MGAWAASVAAVASTFLLAPASGPPGAPPVALSASFVLKTIDAQGSETITGAVSFIPGGDVCVAVKAPRLQEMHLTPRELVIYYPDRDLALVAHLGPQQAPPMLDALAAGMVDPGSTLPAQSQLIERTHVGSSLQTRWRVLDGDGKALGEMRVVEAREGASSVELLQPSGQPQRRFTFADRVRVGARSVPRTIVADYFGAGGKRQREEQWSLDGVARLDPRHAAPADCARLRPQTKVQALTW